MSRIIKKIEARKLCEEGFSYNEIVSKLNISKSSVSLYCSDIVNARNIHNSEHRRSAIADLKAQAIVLCESGLSRRKIALKLNISKSSAQAWCTGIKHAKAKCYTPVTIPDKKSAPGIYPFENTTTYTYTCGDGVTRVHIHYKDGTVKTYKLARYNMCIHEKRILAPHERVVHIDGPSDDISNLRIITPEIREANLRAKRSKICPYCNIPYVANRNSQIYCSVICRAKHISKPPIQIAKPKPPKIKKIRIAKPKPIRIRKPKEIKPSTPKYIYYPCVCEICEGSFQSRDKQSDVCGKKSCRDIIAAYGE